jgi:hypothetical protein
VREIVIAKDKSVLLAALFACEARHNLGELLVPL